MSDDSHDFDLERLAELSGRIDDLVAAFKRAIVDEENDADVLELADDLREVLDELEDVLETIDVGQLPDAIDIEALPETVDVEDVPEGLLDEDEAAIELEGVREAVNLRELWEAVDLTELYEEKQELENELQDVQEDLDGGDEDGGEGIVSDDEGDGLFENVIDTGGANVQFDAETRQAFLEEKIKEAVEKFRSALLSTHEGLRRIYQANQEKLGQPGRHPDSRNPTAVSTLPPGPVPDSVSARTSTVPAQVRYSKVNNPRRIYGRRFAEATDGEGNETPDRADEEPEESADESGSSAQTGAEEEPETDAEDEAEDEAADGVAEQAIEEVIGTDD